MKTFTTLIILFLAMFSQGQYQPGTWDLNRISRCKNLTTGENNRKLTLPVTVDNSVLPWFPGICDQGRFATCQQVSAICHNYCYEINRLRDLPATPGNLYPVHFTYSLLNNGSNDGVSYFESFDIIREMGHVNDDVYPDTLNAVVKWISGADIYRKAMQNRLKGISVIRLTPDSGINTLRQYLYDHLDGSSTGGMAVMTTAITYNFQYFPEGTPEAGKPLILSFLSNANHGFLVFGYHDSVRYDINGDGQYTNHTDINGDGLVNDLDREFGAFKVANTFGPEWQGEGWFYVPYSTMVKKNGEGGLWSECVVIPEPDPIYQPLFTMSLSVSSHHRDQISIRAGISADTAHDYPEHEISFPAFNYQGGNHTFGGVDTAMSAAPFELALDLTPLLSYCQPGMPARFFLVAEALPAEEVIKGYVHKLSFFDHTIDWDIPVSDKVQPIFSGEKLLLSKVWTPLFDKVGITTPGIPPLQEDPQPFQMTATGGTPPYEWSLNLPVTRKETGEPFPEPAGQQIMPVNEWIGYSVINLPFSFPFYGKNYDSLYVNIFGMITCDPVSMPFPYLNDGIRMLKGIPVIAPAFSRHYWRTPGSGYGIWYAENPDWVQVWWKIPSDWYPLSSVNFFSAKLCRNGEITFYYHTMDITPNGWRLFTGLSAGDQHNFLLEEQKNSRLLESKSYRYTPVPQQEGIRITSGGLVIPAPLSGQEVYSLSVKVTDRYGISDTKDFTLAGSLAMDAFLYPGKEHLPLPDNSTPLAAEIINRGALPAENLFLVLRSLDGGAGVTDSTAWVETAGAGNTVRIDSAFRFTPSVTLTEGDNIRFEMSVTGGSYQLNRELVFSIPAPDIHITTPYINDGADGFIDPGEIASLNMEIINTGSAGLKGLTAILIPHDTLVAINGSHSLPVADLPGKSCFPLSYSLKASRNCNPGEISHFTLELRDDRGVVKSLPFTLRTGRFPVAVVNLENDTQCAEAIRRSLEELGIDAPVYTAVPADFSPFRSLFLILGVYGSVSPEEQHRFAAWLRDGGNLYTELYPSRWNLVKNQELFLMYRYTTSTGTHKKVSRIIGSAEGFTADMDFMIHDDQLYAKQLILLKEPGFRLFHDHDSTSKTLGFACAKDAYRVIASLFRFESLHDTLFPSQKTELMKRYLAFMDINYAGPYPLFHADTLCITPGTSILFHDDSYPGITLRQWTFEGAQPATSDLASPLVQYLTPGEYDVELAVSDGIRQRTLKKKSYISVVSALAVPDPSTPIHLKVFPNPVSEKAYLSGLPDGKYTLDISDIAGNIIRIRNVTVAGGIGDVSLSGLARGMYVLRVRAPQYSGAVKVLVF